MSSAIIVPVVMLIVFIFDKSEPKHYLASVHAIANANILNKLRLGKLPFWFAYIAHLIVGLTVTVSAFITILYAFEWGKEKSMEWLGALLLSILQSMLLVTPVQVHVSLISYFHFIFYVLILKYNLII